MSFNDFQFNTHITKAIQACGFAMPTPIQQQAIPAILKRRDLLGLAQTGTGKTAAFILPAVEHLMKSSGKLPRLLIVAPTRELAEQINDFTGSIIRGTRLRSMVIYGGVGKNGQIAALRRGVDIVVACPGRLLDILNDKAIDLSQVQTLVLDEADHMFDKGFLPDIRRILKQLPRQRQSLVFSATMPAEIQHLVEEILTDPVTVRINPSRTVKSVSHQMYAVEQGQKFGLLTHLLKLEQVTSTLVFTRTKHNAKKLANRLAESGFKATSLHGNLSQNKRLEALDGFKNGTFRIMVATDIAARGIDVTGLSHVINFDMPDTSEAYIHRTGRTGRASCTGEALNFATRDDAQMIRVIEKSLDGRMVRRPIDPAVLAVPGSNEQGNGDAERKSVPARRTAKTVPTRQGRRQGDAGSNVFGFSKRSRP